MERIQSRRTRGVLTAKQTHTTCVYCQASQAMLGLGTLCQRRKSSKRKNRSRGSVFSGFKADARRACLLPSRHTLRVFTAKHCKQCWGLALCASAVKAPKEKTDHEESRRTRGVLTARCTLCVLTATSRGSMQTHAGRAYCADTHCVCLLPALQAMLGLGFQPAL